MGATGPAGATGAQGPPGAGLSVLITDFGPIGTADDTTTFKNALDYCSTHGYQLLLPAGSTTTVSSYTILDAGKVDIACVNGKATIQHKPGSSTPILSRTFTLPQIAGIRLRNIIFQGNGAEGTVQTVVGVNWVSAGNAGSWVQIADASKFVSPSGTVIIYNASGTVATGFNYTGVDLANNRLTGLNVNPTTYNGYTTVQPAAKAAVQVWNVSDIDVQDCEFYDFLLNALDLSTVYRTRVHRSRFERMCCVGGSNIINLIDAAQWPPSSGQPSPRSGIHWVSDCYFNNFPSAAVAISVRKTSGDTSARMPKKAMVTGNIIQNPATIGNSASNDSWCGVTTEAGIWDDVIVTGNQMYGLGMGVQSTVSPAAGTINVNGAQAVAAGGNILVNTTANYESVCSGLLTWPDGTTQKISWTSIDATHLNGVTPALTLYGDETIIQYRQSKRTVIANNIIDMENATLGPLSNGIFTQGDEFLIANNYVRYQSASAAGPGYAISAQGNNAASCRGININDNLVVIAPNNASGIRPGGIALGSAGLPVEHCQVRGNTIMRENLDNTVGGMAEGIVLSSVSRSKIADNTLVAPGQKGFYLLNCVDLDIFNNMIYDPGSDAVDAAFYLRSDCWNLRLYNNKAAWSGTGNQYNYAIRVLDRAQRTILKDNDFTGYSAGYLDGQSASTTVAAAGTVAAGGNLALAALTSIPSNGGEATINGVAQTYTRTMAAPKAHVVSGTTGTTVTLSSVAGMPDYGPVTFSIAGAATIVSVNRSTKVVTLSASITVATNETCTASNVMIGVQYGATYAGGEAVTVTGNSFVHADGMRQLAYGATITTGDISRSQYYKIVATNATAFTVSAPLYPVAGSKITYDIKNSAGATGTITWNAAFLVQGGATGFAGPGVAGKRRLISFVYDGANWVETYRSTADI